jgi:hypothetical protein
MQLKVPRWVSTEAPSSGNSGKKKRYENVSCQRFSIKDGAVVVNAKIAISKTDKNFR